MYTILQVANDLRTNPASVKRWIKTGALEAEKKEYARNKFKYLISKEALDAFLRKNPKYDYLETTMTSPPINDQMEAVDHPAHYNREGAMECLDEMILLYGEEATMHFCLLSAHKYRYRAGEKGGLEDMQKSDWYLKKYKELKALREELPY